MVAIKARFDGERIILPDDMRGLAAGEVILIFDEAGGEEGSEWLKAQEPAFLKAWDNDEDAVYDSM